MDTKRNTIHRLDGLSLAKAIRQEAARYAVLSDPASCTHVRARLLTLIDQLSLDRGAAIVTRRVTSQELAQDAVLRGAAVLHLDLVFRSSVTSEEICLTAERGIVRFAYHPGLEAFPIGVVLAQPVDQPVRRRAELFVPAGQDSPGAAPSLAHAAIVMPYALAASPGRLGAGTALLRAVIADVASASASAEPAPSPRVVTFSPLTGMRARVIRLVDDSDAWAAVAGKLVDIDTDELRLQLQDLLDEPFLPNRLGEPARTWLANEARVFADSSDYAVGNFHRAMGAKLTGLAHAADPEDSDALWARAYFDYGHAY